MKNDDYYDSLDRQERSTFNPSPAGRERELEAENARLRAELDALRPKPVIEVLYANLHNHSFVLSDSPWEQNLKLTFTDGNLTHAEVLK